MFQSTRPARGATGTNVASSTIAGGFNPRAPRGARPTAPGLSDTAILFQSTRPARGATHRVAANLYARLFQSTRPARGATRTFYPYWFPPSVSIHAPRAGRDVNSCAFSIVPERFQSTRPARGATTRPARTASEAAVSIHAPRAGRDGLALTYTIGKSSSHRSADPPAVPPATRHADPSPFANLKPDRRLRFARTSLDSSVRLGSALHTISGPSGSYDGLAPTCSTRPFQFSPRK